MVLRVLRCREENFLQLSKGEVTGYARKCMQEGFCGSACSTSTGKAEGVFVWDLLAARFHVVAY